MRAAPEEEHALTLHDYLRVVKRRAWIIALVTIVLTAAAVAVSERHGVRYTASSDVLLTRQNVASSSTSSSTDPTRILATQAGVAEVPEVASRTIAAAHVRDMTSDQFLSHSRVTAVPGTDMLRFTVTNASASLAVRLSTEYAKQYIAYRHELDTAAIVQARKPIDEQIAALKKAGRTDSQVYAVLVSKDQELQTAEALQASNASLVRSAASATKVRAKQVQDGLLGFGLGLVLGTILAFIIEALDSRVRSAEEIGEALGVPLLARIPRPPRRRRGAGQLAMIAAPHSLQSESFRVLRTNLELVNLVRSVRTIVVTSGLEAEGKSTTVANVAVALARSGERVTLVDFDLRQPTLHHFFGIGREPGLTDVARGHVALEDALVPIALTDSPGDNGTNGHGGRVMGFLEVLPSGQIPPDPGEVVAARVIDDILGRLRDRADIVLMDSPPILQVGDALALSAKADGLVIVTRLNLVRRGVIKELHRVLRASPATKLGFVLTGARLDEAGRRGYSYRDLDSLPRDERVADRTTSL